MVRIALITRSTLFDVPGGDTVQIVNLSKYLLQHNVEATIRLSDEVIDYPAYDMLHFFNLTRPADILHHIRRSNRPFAITPIAVDYSEYDKTCRGGITGFIFRHLKPDSIEYLKTVARLVNGTDTLSTPAYLWTGQRRSIQEILQQASMIFPSSEMETQTLQKSYNVVSEHILVHNGIDDAMFQFQHTEKDPQLVICVARIEGLKNQLNLIRALNNTRFTLLLIGSSAPNHKQYYKLCKKAAARNVTFIEHLPQHELFDYYLRAKVHILPSWFETCGLSSLEAAAMGCSIVISKRGFASEYFGDNALYCDPASPQSILDAVCQAAEKPADEKLSKMILEKYTWNVAAEKTAHAYKRILHQI